VRGGEIEKLCTVNAERTDEESVTDLADSAWA
jgi:hypothetical protein